MHASKKPLHFYKSQHKSSLLIPAVRRKPMIQAHQSRTNERYSTSIHPVYDGNTPLRTDNASKATVKGLSHNVLRDSGSLVTDVPPDEIKGHAAVLKSSKSKHLEEIAPDPKSGNLLPQEGDEANSQK